MLTTKIPDISENNKYEKLVNETIYKLACKKDNDFRRILFKAQGIFPVKVVNILKTLGLYSLTDIKRQRGSQNNSKPIQPELHLLDFEWYFENSSANELARLLGSNNKTVLCMGTPKVAKFLSKMEKNFLLVDKNPLILKRKILKIEKQQFYCHDLLMPIYLKEKFRCVFFDAPWYEDYILYWLWQSAKHVKAGGIIGFTLFPSLTRPTAYYERERIIEAANLLGNIEILNNVISYETPAFEREVLLNANIDLDFGWRRGDLVLVKVNKIPEVIKIPNTIKIEPWDTFVVGNQTIKLRPNSDDNNRFILRPINNRKNFFLPSVSAREKSRSIIDIWTSRNKIAEVGSKAYIRSILIKYSSYFSSNISFRKPQTIKINSNLENKIISKLKSCLGIEIEEKKNVV
jgi:hypothetical protein